MIINNILQGIAGAYMKNVNQPAQQKKVNADEARTGRDEIVISNAARNFSPSLQAIRTAAENVREDKVAFYKEKIENGTYQIDAQAIAEKMMTMRY